jgi:flagellar biosynthesis protein FlhF
MKLKSYFAATVAGAIEQARGEMGPEAVIVQSRPAPPEAKHLGKYEVVVAQMSEAEAESRAPHLGASGTATDPIAKELARLHRQMEELRRLMWRCGAGSSRWRSRPVLSVLNDRLTGIGLDADLAEEIVACAEARLAGDPLLERGGEEPGLEGTAGEDRGRAWTCLLAELKNRIQVDASLGKPGAQPRVVALVGPPGAGKTTALVKLAVEAGLKSRRPMALLTTDTSRIGSAWQLRTFAGILGVAFQALDTPLALGQAIEEHRGKDLILIDTPGLGRAEIDEARELAGVLSRGDVDTHLVLEATGNSADLLDAVDRFAIFEPSKLLLTKLDETVTPGSALTVAFRAGKPVSYVSAGQRIPEDLQAANREVLLNRLLENCRMEVPAWLEMRSPGGFEAASAGLAAG